MNPTVPDPVPSLSADCLVHIESDRITFNGKATLVPSDGGGWEVRVERDGVWVLGDLEKWQMAMERLPDRGVS